MAWTHNEMALRAAQELEDGFSVNPGIGLPTTKTIPSLQLSFQLNTL